MIEIEWDDRRITQALKDLEKATGDLTPAFKEIKEILVESVQQRFVTKTGPDGEKWDDNTDVTMWAPKKNPSGGYSIKGRNDPLIGYGSLMEQIHGEVVGNNILEIGSSMQYAAMQQFGGTKAEFPYLWGDIPARPFLGISFEDDAAIMEILREHLSDAIK